MSAPFATLELFGSGTGLALAVLLGFGFGFVLERAGFGSSRRLAAQFYLYDMTVFKVMFTAIVTAMVGLFGLVRVGWVNLDMVWVNPTFLWPQIIGGFLLGAGFIISGYCPGTCIVASASGKIDGLLTLSGVFAGIGIFALADGPALQALHESGSHGRLMLSDLLGIDPMILAVGVALMAGAAFIGAEAVEKRFSWRAEPGRGPRRTPRVVLATLGGIALAGVLFLLPPVHPRVPVGTNAATEQITPLELARKIVEGYAGVAVIDLRGPDAAAEGSIPHAAAVSPRRAGGTIRLAKPPEPGASDRARGRGRWLGLSHTGSLGIPCSRPSRRVSRMETGCDDRSTTAGRSGSRDGRRVHGASRSRLVLHGRERHRGSHSDDRPAPAVRRRQESEGCGRLLMILRGALAWNSQMEARGCS